MRSRSTGEWPRPSSRSASLLGLLAGAVPAAWAGATRVATLLGNTAARGSHGRLRRGLVTVQVALSFVLLCAGGLLVRSFSELLRARPGFDAAHVLTMRVPVPSRPLPRRRRGPGPPRAPAVDTGGGPRREGGGGRLVVAAVGGRRPARRPLPGGTRKHRPGAAGSADRRPHPRSPWISRGARDPGPRGPQLRRGGPFGAARGGHRPHACREVLSKREPDRRPPRLVARRCPDGGGCRRPRPPLRPPPRWSLPGLRPKRDQDEPLLAAPDKPSAPGSRAAGASRAAAGGSAARTRRRA